MQFQHACTSQPVKFYFTCMTMGILTTVLLYTAVTTLVKDLSGSDCGNEG